TPPVRVRELVDAFTPGNLHSICAADYTGALAAIADRIQTKIIPACYYGCAADSNGETQLLEPDCRVDMVLPGVGEVVVPECLRDEQGGVPRRSGLGQPCAAGRRRRLLRHARGRGHADGRSARRHLQLLPRAGVEPQFELAYRTNVTLPADRSLSATCKITDDEPADGC
ncbi:MAG: hypothetical protein HC927_01665, partial [Deltaproteobacteria bacterium]|nr:hypothetical protein [Deltaproteobacteria bacterium]